MVIVEQAPPSRPDSSLGHGHGHPHRRDNISDQSNISTSTASTTTAVHTITLRSLKQWSEQQQQQQHVQSGPYDYSGDHVSFQTAGAGAGGEGQQERTGAAVQNTLTGLGFHTTNNESAYNTYSSYPDAAISAIHHLQANTNGLQQQHSHTEDLTLGGPASMQTHIAGGMPMALDLSSSSAGIADPQMLQQHLQYHLHQMQQQGQSGTHFQYHHHQQQLSGGNSPITWSPESAPEEYYMPLDANALYAQHQQEQVQLQEQVQAQSHHYSSKLSEPLHPYADSPETTLKRGIVNPTTYFPTGSVSPPSITPAVSAPTSPTRLTAHHPSSFSPHHAQLRAITSSGIKQRKPLPFGGATTNSASTPVTPPNAIPMPVFTPSLLAVQDYGVNVTSNSASPLPPCTPLSLPDGIGPPQVTLSPPYGQTQTPSRTDSPGETFAYTVDACDMPLPPSTASSFSSFGSHSFGVGGDLQDQLQTSLLAPLIIYQQQQLASGLALQYEGDIGITYDLTKSANNRPKSSLENPYHLQSPFQVIPSSYREQYSPGLSSAGSLSHSQQSEASTGDGRASTSSSFQGNITSSPSAMQFLLPNQSDLHSAHFAYSHNMQQLALSPSASPPSSQRYVVGPGAPPHPGLYRSASASTSPSRPSAMPTHRSLNVRNSSHPYASVYDSYVTPPVPVSRQQSRQNSSSESDRHSSSSLLQFSDGPISLTSTPELRPIGKDGSAAGPIVPWVIPSAEEVRQAAFELPSGMPVEMGASTVNGKVPRRLTRATSKSGTTAQLFPIHAAAGAGPVLGLPTFPSQDSQTIFDGTSGSLSIMYPHLNMNLKLPAASQAKLEALDKLPASGKAERGKPSSTTFVHESIIPLHLLPAKRSRGRRPVISPQLEIDAAIESTTASTEEQRKFTGLTKTGKPKKIFVCRVPECNKCFRRSEHLKRHIRSIHTHDKRKTCSWFSIKSILPNACIQPFRAATTVVSGPLRGLTT